MTFAEPQEGFVRPGAACLRAACGPPIILALAVTLSMRAFCRVCACLPLADDTGYLTLMRALAAVSGRCWIAGSTHA
jgi:hypothetical protein